MCQMSKWFQIPDVASIHISTFSMKSQQVNLSRKHFSQKKTRLLGKKNDKFGVHPFIE